jgi:sugar-specific transcriptional regulator TrmB
MVTIKGKVLDYLQQLGLADVEAKLYFSLLKRGEMSVKDLAETIDLKRTTAYFHIDRLANRGLILKTVNGSKSHVVANSPEDLKKLLDVKLKETDDLERNFPNILQTLTASQPQETPASSAEIRYYKGKNGVMKIYEEAMKAKELRSYVNIEVMRKAIPENEILFPSALKINKIIKIYEILENTPTSNKLITEFQAKSHNDNRFYYKFLPQGVKLSSVDILIFDGKVAIININPQLTGLVLHNADYFNNSKGLFDLMWNVFK